MSGSDVSSVEICDFVCLCGLFNIYLSSLKNEDCLLDAENHHHDDVKNNELYL